MTYRTASSLLERRKGGEAAMILLKPLQILYVIYAMILFLIMMLIVIPFVLIASFFGKIKGGNAVMRIVHWWADVWLFMIGIFHSRIVEQEIKAHQPQKTMQAYHFLNQQI